MRLRSLRHLVSELTSRESSRRIVVLGSASLLDGFDSVFALDPCDLAAVKVVVGREKDLTLVRGLLRLNKITEEKLRERLHTMPLGEKEMFRAGRNFAEVTKP